MPSRVESSLRIFPPSFSFLLARRISFTDCALLRGERERRKKVNSSGRNFFTFQRRKSERLFNTRSRCRGRGAASGHGQGWFQCATCTRARRPPTSRTAPSCTGARTTPGVADRKPSLACPSTRIESSFPSTWVLDHRCSSIEFVLRFRGVLRARIKWKRGRVYRERRKYD